MGSRKVRSNIGISDRRLSRGGSVKRAPTSSVFTVICLARGCPTAERSHSTGGGELARYIGRHGTKRVAKAVLVSAVTPLMLRTDANPGGLPIEAFDRIRAGVAADRSQFFKEVTTPFYGANRLGANGGSQGVRDAFWFQGMQGGLKNELDCIKAFSEADFTEDLKKFDMPTLIIQGDDDQIVPIGAAAYASSKLVKNATPEGVPGWPPRTRRDAQRRSAARG